MKTEIKELKKRVELLERELRQLKTNIKHWYCEQNGISHLINFERGF